MDLAQIKTRRDAAWSEKGGWSALYGEAYDYAIPYRRSVHSLGGAGGASLGRDIYDITAPIGVQRGSGRLREDLFGGPKPFELTPGPLAELAFRKRGEEGDLELFRRELQELSAELRIHMATGEWETATGEMCVDLYAGTGCLLPLAAAPDDPGRFVRFLALGFEDYAFAPGGYGDVGGLYWKSRQPREAILGKWPNGVFPDEFRRLAGESPHELVEINQDFVRDGARGWKMVVALPECERPIATEKMRARPFASPRYFVVPGELYGRGPLLMSLGAVRTLNMVVEISLKASALQMLGVWGYRPSSGVNPAAFSLAPGSFWPMFSTGGSLGPDVFRMDTGGNEIQIGNIVQEELRAQIRAALNDDALPDGGKSPKSATEIMERVARLKANHVGSFGRMMHETTPVIVPRVMEILRERRALVSRIEIDDMLTRVMVTSPMAQALRATALQSILEYVQVIGMLQGPQAVARMVHIDEMLAQVGIDMGVAAKWIRTAAERKAFDEQAAAQQAQQMLAQSAMQDPKGMAEAAGMIEDPAASGRPTLRAVA